MGKTAFFQAFYEVILAVVSSSRSRPTKSIYFLPKQQKGDFEIKFSAMILSLCYAKCLILNVLWRGGAFRFIVYKYNRPVSPGFVGYAAIAACGDWLNLRVPDYGTNSSAPIS